ncbi:lipoprotein [Streptomyces phaeoluteigriseus]|uniref:lipoprotein n=1 Tax=Streptomyces phaeoluteigriseus TaxID=114686 RepID=UPI000B067B9C|nr:lipoprotein [Streptomyces phaeoluteigriseus]
MRFGVGNGWRGIAAAVLLTGMAAGCGESGEDSGPAGGKGSATAEVAARGETIGAAGSACELPVTFDIAEFWEAERIDAAAQHSDTDDEVSDAVGDALADAFLHQGPVTMACEVDAKPAGKLGFLRVWTGKPGDADARDVLEGFVGAEKTASGEKYRAFRSGSLSGTEVEYTTTSELLEETKKERALAVSTPDGPVVVHLGGMDTEEHEAMLPAYELAKRTLKATA